MVPMTRMRTPKNANFEENQRGSAPLAHPSAFCPQSHLPLSPCRWRHVQRSTTIRSTKLHGREEKPLAAIRKAPPPPKKQSLRLSGPLRRFRPENGPPSSVGCVPFRTVRMASFRELGSEAKGVEWRKTYRTTWFHTELREGVKDGNLQAGQQYAYSKYHMKQRYSLTGMRHRSVDFCSAKKECE